MYIDYQKLVVQDYEKKKAANQLPPRLIQPTPANLKEACMTQCSTNYQRKDGKILGDFFKTGQDQDALCKAIKKMDTSKFKPLQNFLNKKTSDTDLKNIELLAWLIDFEPRPYVYGKNYVTDTGDTDIIVPENGDDDTQEKRKEKEAQKETFNKETPISEPIDDISDTPESQPLIIDPPKSKMPLKIVLSTFFLAAIIGIIYWSIRAKNTDYGNCMYWNVDHYEQIACAPTHGDTLVIPLDSAKLLHFKKITQTDTITYNDIGRIWYLKSNGNIEFFTASGCHPVLINRRLHPITQYMIDQYIHYKH